MAGIAPAAATALVEVRDVSKQFGGAVALRGISMTVRPGTVHALVGENGAGKSTLGKIITGVHRPDAGEVTIGGETVRFRSPRDALRMGVALISQELALVPRRTVLENVYLGNTPQVASVVREGAVRSQYRELTQRLGIYVDPERKVGSLRLAEAQQVEILRAAARQARLIVMDEPTAALPREEAESLFAAIAKLVGSGATIVYVSHNLDDVLRLANEVSILRDGQLVRSGPASAETSETLITAMLGRSLEVVFPPKRYPSDSAATVCSIRGLRSASLVNDVSFDVRAGEIVGIAGMVGSGRTELARAIFGADRRLGGEVELDGKPVPGRHPRQAIKAGIAMVPEDRKTQGLIMQLSAIANVSLASHDKIAHGGWIRTQDERQAAGALFDTVDLRAHDPGAPVWTLSGGNQQKVLFGRWLRRKPRLLIVDEPTRGVDVGAKRSIYELLTRLAAEGLATIVISSELDEVLGLAHRVLVMRRGSLVGDFDLRAADARTIMNAALAADTREEAVGA